MNYPQHLIKLIDVLKRLPGVGNKSAERFAFHMLNWPDAHVHEMARVIHELPSQIQQCDQCGCLMNLEECVFCRPERSASQTLCIIASPRDAFSIEGTGEYRGLYHVLNGLLSPMDGFGPERLNITKIKQRIQQTQVKEVVIALDSTLEGDATSLYLKQELESLGLPISRLAFGLPIGSSLDYVDGGTLARALSGRGKF
jgi:recombination protein RecR